MSDPENIEQRIWNLESLVNAQATTLDLMGGNASVEIILQDLLRGVQQQTGGSLVSVLLADNEGSLGAVISYGPDLDDQNLAGSVSTDGKPAEYHRAAFRDGPLFVADLSTDPGWSRARTSASAAGLRACRAVPIAGSDGALLGTLAVYWPTPTSPDSGEPWMQEQYARLARVALERHRFQEQVGEMLADERRRLAEDLHDDPIQAITTVGLGLQRLSRIATPEQQTQLVDLQVAVSGAVERMRGMLFDLHPPTLDDEGLGSAVELYLYERLDPLGIAWELTDEVSSQLNHHTASLAYRLVREALANVAVHAEATNVSVSLSDAGGRLEAKIVDDGKGFDTSAVVTRRPGHLGMASCQFLARRASGQWTVTSEALRGTSVEIWLPTGLG